MMNRKVQLVSPDTGHDTTHTEPTPAPAPETQQFDAPESTGSLRFALLWFGLPLLLLVALIVLRRPG